MLDTIGSFLGNVKTLTVVVLGCVALFLLVPAFLRGMREQPEKKCMTRKTKAEVTKTNHELYRKEEGIIWVDYAFTVDGRTYTGCGWYNKAEYDLFHKIKVFYDPEDPSKNCTNLDRSQMGTNGPVFLFGVIVLIIAAVFLAY